MGADTMLIQWRHKSRVPSLDIGSLHFFFTAVLSENSDAFYHYFVIRPDKIFHKIKMKK